MPAAGPKARLDQRQIARLEQALLDGPAAAGWVEDQRWTLARVSKLIGRMFHVSYSLKSVALLLHRMGWTPRCRSIARRNAMTTRWPPGGRRRGRR